MATKASMAARVQVARDSAEQSMERIAAGLGVDVPPPIVVAYGKDPEMRAVASTERIAGFLATLAEKVGADPVAPEPQSEEPAADTGNVASMDDAPEPEFHGHKLSEFDGMTDAEILAFPKIGRKALADIRAAQAGRD